MMKNGYIKLHRRIMDWEWYDDANTMRLFIHLLLTVNIEEYQWHGETIKRGSRMTTYSDLARELNLSIQQVRTALSHLKSTREITVSNRSKYSVVTVLNFNKYQELTRKATGNQQANNTMSNNEVTNCQQQYKKNKEDKEIREDRERARACVVNQSLLDFCDSELHVSGKQLEQDLIYFLEHGATESLIREAVAETVRKGKGYGYTKGILENCIREGKRSLSAGRSQGGNYAGPASYDLEEFEKLGFHIPGGKNSHEG